nr:DUF805 domain-containing protein [uncultured Sphingomonas sp.]
MDWATLPLKKYADFSGRAPRAEYWWFYLFEIILFCVAIMLDALSGGGFGGTPYGLFTAILGLGLIIPGLAVTIRRLHDTDRSGWWILIALVPLIGGIILLVFSILQGTLGTNRYGPDPYGA